MIKGPFVLTIDGADFSDCVMQQEGIQETPTYINGPNVGQSKVGTPIWDRIRTTYGFEIPIKPLPQARYAALAAACEPNSVTLVYLSFGSETPRTVRAQLSLSTIKYAMQTAAGTRIYHGTVLRAEFLND